MTGVARPVVCVVGAGTAGLEGILSAAEQLGTDAELRLIAPELEFRYRPMSHSSLLRPAQERRLAIADLVAQVGATWVVDRADFVDQNERIVVTREGDTVHFDFLLLALGARSARTLRQGYVWERGGDPDFLDRIIRGLAAGELRSVAVAVPRGARWPIPAYELALILAWTATGSDARVTLLTAEEQPLSALGPEATKTVARELDAAGVDVVSGVEVIDEHEGPAEGSQLAELIILPEGPADEPGALVARPSDPARVRLGTSSVEFERLISLPTMVGPFIDGVTTDAIGFIEVDERLKVCGSERIWAAGRCISAALEHSALSARQADAAIAAIAAAGAGETKTGSGRLCRSPELAGILLTGQRDQWLAENPVGTREPSTRCLWWPPGRAVGRMLAQHIAAWDPSVHQTLPSHPGGLEIRAPVALGCSERSSVVSAGAPVSADVRNARLRDIENRQQMAVRRRGREAAAELQALEDRLQTLAARERAVVHELQQHGYLRDHDDEVARRPK